MSFANFVHLCWLAGIPNIHCFMHARTPAELRYAEATYAHLSRWEEETEYARR